MKKYNKTAVKKLEKHIHGMLEKHDGSELEELSYLVIENASQHGVSLSTIITYEIASIMAGRRNQQV